MNRRAGEHLTAATAALSPGGGTAAYARADRKRQPEPAGVGTGLPNHKTIAFEALTVQRAPTLPWKALEGEGRRRRLRGAAVG
jgi:hypothetical protein